MARSGWVLGLAGLMSAATMAAAPGAAQAQDHGGYGYAQPERGYDGDHYGRRGYDHEGYRGGAYPRRGDDRREYRGRYRCHREGTGGAIIGAIAGGLLGNAVAGYGNRAAGTIIGGGAGALAGSAIARDGC